VATNSQWTTRKVMWQRWALDWIRTITNCFGFGLDPDWASLQYFRIRTGFGLSYWNRIAAFLFVKSCLLFIFRTSFDLNLTFKRSFGVCLDLDCVLQIQVGIWIIEYDSPLISAMWATCTTLRTTGLNDKLFERRLIRKGAA